MALDEESKIFVMHIATLEASPRSVRIRIYPLWAAQITALKPDKASTKVSLEYADYTNVFFFDLAMKLPENTDINEHAIELQNDKQPPHRPIYSLRPVELETLKTYIEFHLKTGFIWTSKSLASALILFDKKPNGSLWLCVSYQDLNNLTIKKWYTLPLIGKALDGLGRAKQFTQLDLTSAYHQIKIRKGNE